MSSVLDALSEEQQEVIHEIVGYHRLKRELVRDALGQMVLQRLVRQIPVAQPAAGSDWTVAVPQGVTWELISVMFTLATSAVVANRGVRIIVKDNNGVISTNFQAPGNIAANANALVGLGQGYGDHLLTSGQYGPLPTPAYPVPIGATILSSTSNLDAGDQYSSVVIVAREWSTLRLVSIVENLLADLDSGGGIPYSSIV